MIARDQGINLLAAPQTFITKTDLNSYLRYETQPIANTNRVHFYVVNVKLGILTAEREILLNPDLKTLKPGEFPKGSNNTLSEIVYPCDSEADCLVANNFVTEDDRTRLNSFDPLEVRDFIAQCGALQRRINSVIFKPYCLVLPDPKLKSEYPVQAGIDSAGTKHLHYGNYCHSTAKKAMEANVRSKGLTLALDFAIHHHLRWDKKASPSGFPCLVFLPLLDEEYDENSFHAPVKSFGQIINSFAQVNIGEPQFREIGS